MASSGESPADVAPSGADRTAATRRPGVAALQLVVLRLQTSRSTFRRYRRLAPERLARSGHAMARRWASVVQVRVSGLEPWFFAYPQAVGRQTAPALLPAACCAGAEGKGLEGGNPRTKLEVQVRACHTVPHTREEGASISCAPGHDHTGLFRRTLLSEASSHGEKHLPVDDCRAAPRHGASVSTPSARAPLAAAGAVTLMPRCEASSSISCSMSMSAAESMLSSARSWTSRSEANSGRSDDHHAAPWVPSPAPPSSPDPLGARAAAAPAPARSGICRLGTCRAHGATGAGNPRGIRGSILLSQPSPRCRQSIRDIVAGSWCPLAHARVRRWFPERRAQVLAALG